MYVLDKPGVGCLETTYLTETCIFLQGLIIEFLFALPRFANSPEDRVNKARESRVGTIEVRWWPATFKRRELKLDKIKPSGFSQANKKVQFDACRYRTCIIVSPRRCRNTISPSQVGSMSSLWLLPPPMTPSLYALLLHGLLPVCRTRTMSLRASSLCPRRGWAR